MISLGEMIGNIEYCSKNRTDNQIFFRKLNRLNRNFYVEKKIDITFSLENGTDNNNAFHRKTFAKKNFTKKNISIKNRTVKIAAHTDNNGFLLKIESITIYLMCN